VNSPRTTLYRDKQNAKLMGVCSGIADYTGVNVFWVRLGVLHCRPAAEQEARASLCRPRRTDILAARTAESQAHRV